MVNCIWQNRKGLAEIDVNCKVTILLALSSSSSLAFLFSMKSFKPNTTSAFLLELPTESLEGADVTLLMESPLGPSEGVGVVLGTDLVLESPLDSPCTLLLTPISSWLNFKLTVAIFVPGCFKRLYLSARRPKLY